MGPVGAADIARACLRQPDVADLARLDEIGHRPDGFFNRRRRVGTMLIIQIDVIDAEPLQRAIAALAHIVGLAADPKPCAVRAAHDAELRRDASARAMVASDSVSSAPP